MLNYQRVSSKKLGIAGLANKLSGVERWSFAMKYSF